MIGYLIVSFLYRLGLKVNVAKLCKRDEEMGSAVYLYYFCGCSYSSLAKILLIDRRKANVLVKAGTTWLDTMLMNTLYEEMQNA